jgi:hypothetical protein
MGLPSDKLKATAPDHPYVPLLLNRTRAAHCRVAPMSFAGSAKRIWPMTYARSGWEQAAMTVSR